MELNTPFYCEKFTNSSKVHTFGPNSPIHYRELRPVPIMLSNKASIKYKIGYISFIILSFTLPWLFLKTHERAQLLKPYYCHETPLGKNQLFLCERLFYHKFKGLIKARTLLFNRVVFPKLKARSFKSFCLTNSALA